MSNSSTRKTMYNKTIWTLSLLISIKKYLQHLTHSPWSCHIHMYANSIFSLLQMFCKKHEQEWKIYFLVNHTITITKSYNIRTSGVVLTKYYGSGWCTRWCSGYSSRFAPMGPGFNFRHRLYVQMVLLIHARSRRVSPGSRVSSCLQNWNVFGSIKNTPSPRGNGELLC